VPASREAKEERDEGPVLTDGASNPISAMLSPLLKKSKSMTPSSSPLRVQSSSVVLPHPEKRSWGGEDAIYSKGGVYGVFDGVSGAEKQEGMALYSKTLAAEMDKEVSKLSATSFTLRELSDILSKATDIADASATGASTALAGSVGSDNRLRVVSLGDCVTLVIRNGRPYCRSKVGPDEEHRTARAKNVWSEATSKASYRLPT